MRNIAVLFATACVCTMLTACGNEVSADCTKESMEVQNNESIEIESKVQETVLESYVDVPEKILNLLEIGTYEGNIAFNGGERDEKNITRKKKSLLFPQCSIRTIIANTAGTNPFFVDVDKKEVIKLIDLIEQTNIRVIEGKETQILNKEKVFTTEEFPISADLKLVLLNSAGDYQYVYLTAFKSNIVDIYVESNDTQYCLMPNQALTEQIKKLAKYRVVTKKQLKSITRMQLTNTTTNTSYELNPKEMEAFVTSMESAKQIQEIHSTLVDIVATMSDGTTIQMKFDPRSKELAIEGEVYAISENTVNVLMGTGEEEN